MSKPTLDWRTRLTLCTMVAEELARIFNRSRKVAKVALHGSVARGTPGHFCGDVDLMLFLANPDSVEWVQGQPEDNRLYELLMELCCIFPRTAVAEEDRIRAVARGFASFGDDHRMGDDTFLPVPVSIHLLPASLNVDTFCAFQAAQPDPQFLTKIGRDLRIWDPTDKRFVRQGAPWDNIPWREHMSRWRTENGLTLPAQLSTESSATRSRDPRDEILGRPLLHVMGKPYECQDYDYACDWNADTTECGGCLLPYYACSCPGGCPTCGGGSCNCAYT